MKRYLLFMGDDGRGAQGGWKDFFSSFDSIESALLAVGSHEPDWWEIVDINTGKIVVEG